MNPRLYINAVSTKAGGGLNDLVQTLPLLSRRLRECGWSVRTFVVEAGRKGLADAGCDLRDVVCVDVGGPIRRANWEWRTWPRLVRRERPGAVLQFSNLLFRRLATPQVIVLRSRTFFSQAYAAQRSRGIYQRLRLRLGRYYSIKTLRIAAAVFCISQTHRRQIIERAGTAGERVRVAHLGVSIPADARAISGRSREQLVEQMPEASRATLQPAVQSGRHIVLNVAHYYSQKNFYTLLQAFDQLSQIDSDIALVITAGITRYSGARTEQTDREVALARELEKRGVLFDLGPVPKSAVWPLLALADVFAFPSSLESFGHPLLEAMGMSIPVVAADTGIHREICGDAAIFHETFDPQSLAQSIRKVLDEPETRAQLIERGSKNITRFNWDAHVDKLVAAILEVSDAAEPGRERGGVVAIADPRLNPHPPLSRHGGRG